MRWMVRPTTKVARLALAWCCGVAVFAAGATLSMRNARPAPLDELQFCFHILNRSLFLLFASLALAVVRLVYLLTGRSGERRPPGPDRLDP